MDQLWISLPWPQPGTWPPYESGTVGGALRLANCLRVAAGKAGWGSKRLPPNTAMGLAVSSAEERQSPTWVAGVAEVTVDPATGKYTHQQGHDRDGHGDRHQPEQHQGADDGLGVVGRQPGACPSG